MFHTHHLHFGLLLSSLVACAGDATSTSPPSEPEPAWIAKLDAMHGELPEGLAIDADAETAFVGLAPSGRILAIGIASGDVRAFGSVPALPPNEGYLLGLALNERGELFAAVASSSEGYAPGIYRLPAVGGEGVLFASHPELRFPNGLAFDARGELFVTDSLSGAVYRVDAHGHAEIWAHDPRLSGDMQGPCANGAAFPIGANGIALERAAAYVVNTDHGTLLRIAREADGSAGEMTTMVASDCATLGGADGLTLGDDGTLYVAANAIDAITRVSPRGDAQVIFAGSSFDFPASVALHTDDTGKRLFITNAALKRAMTPGQTPRPGLLTLDLND